MAEESDYRLPRRSSRDTEDRVQGILAKFEATSNDLTIMRMLANAPTAFRPFVLLSDALISHGTVPADVRETAILQCAVLTGSAYEWEQHVPLAAASGISADAIRAIRTGNIDQAPLTPEQQLAAQIADHLVRDGQLPDEPWREAVLVWGNRGAAELLLIVAIWGGLIPIVLRGLDLHTDPDYPGDSSRAKPAGT
jgi:alkylhydroperoxidase family enzyme